MDTEQIVGAALELARAVRETARDLSRGLRRPDWRGVVREELELAPVAVTKILPWLVRARDDRDESLVRLALEHAQAYPDGLALEMGGERVTWGELAATTSRLAHVLDGAGVKRGDVVVLLGSNSPFYVAATLAISRVGATASLVNSHLEGQPLVHAFTSSAAQVAIVEARLAPLVRREGELSARLSHLLVYGEGGDVEAKMAAAPDRPFPRVVVPVASDFVYIFTSGTTGLPKPCRVTHGRALVAAAAFGHAIFRFEPGDKLYSVLPLYHSSAMLIGVGSCIVTRTPLAMREAFSASAFWKDVQRYRATHMLYIGELCRYLLNTPPCEEEARNPIRVAVGNGLRADLWEAFSTRFGIPAIREFYSATEAPGAIFNLTGRVGSCGRMPMRRLMPLKLARYDVDRDEYVRGPDGYVEECEAGEVGELLLRLPEKARSAIGDFRGYTDPAATQKKIVGGVFRKGDRFFRTGDLMRFDEDDWFFFVDRIGDTYRWKGENVSTAEVMEVLSRAPGVREIAVVGVEVPGTEGRCGLAAVVAEGSFDPEAFARATRELPDYAQPRFVRVMSALDTTGTFKIKKSDLRADGVDPSRVGDPLFVRTDAGYEPLTAARWSDVAAGRLRL